MFESLNVIKKKKVACSVQPSSYGYTSEVFLALKKLTPDGLTDSDAFSVLSNFPRASITRN